MRHGICKLARFTFSRSGFNLRSNHLPLGATFPVVQRLLVTNAHPNTRSERLMNDVNHKIDYNLGISFQLFNSLVQSLENDGPLSEQSIGLLLHICSIGPFDCPTKKRLENADHIWSKLEEQGITPSIKLYNIKLKAYCLNKKDFNPLDELMTLKSLGLNPDRVTYTLLIEAFCLKGDIEGANSVLEAMKTSQLTINVAVFNSFVTGHLKAGSPEEAAEVFELIRSSGLSPNVHTYFRFASWYAEEGDISSVMKYITEADDEGVPLDNQMLLELYKTMVTSGHKDSASKLLEIVSEKGIFTASIMQKSCHLLSEGFQEAAVDLYSQMPKMDDGKSANAGSFLLQCMVVNDYNSQEIYNMADKIVEMNPTALFAHRNALQYAYKAGRIDLAMELLDLMIAKNHTIKVPYVIPAICHYRDKGDVDGTCKAIEILLNITSTGIIDDKFDQIMRCCLPALKKLHLSREAITDRFKADPKLWNSVFFVDDVGRENIEVALSNAEGKELDGLIFLWPDVVFNFFKYLPEDIDSCVKVLDFMNSQRSISEQSFNTFTTRLVKYVITMKNWEALEKLLDGLIEKRISLIQNLKQARALSEAPTQVKEKLDQLCVADNFTNSSRQDQRLSKEQMEALSEEELRKYLKKNPNNFLPRYVLLDKAMEANDLESMRQLLREIQVLGFHLSIVRLLQVISKLCSLHDTETALICFDDLKKQTNDAYKPTVPLMIGEELMKQGNVDGALEMIKIAKETQFHDLDNRTKISRKILLSALLKETPTAEDATKVHSAIFETEHLVPKMDALAIHAAYIRRMSSLEDDGEFVETLLNLYHTHGVFPLHSYVLERLIKKKDVENLKKVMAMGNAAFGSHYFHHKLAISFIRCGMPARGGTILQTPGLRTSERILATECQNLVKNKQIETLESLVGVVKDMPVSQANMLGHLVEGYVSIDNLKQATESLQHFVDDYKEPNKSTVEFLKEAYTKKGEEVPELLDTLLAGQQDDKGPEKDNIPA